MRAYGSDRLRTGEGGQLLLSCRVPKDGWKPRIAKTLTSAEHPGTAVQWDEALYEVVDIEWLANGVCYTLEPWRDEHAVRVADVYDARSEGRRAADRRDVARRKKKRRWVVAFGFIYGHFPAAVQEHLGNELGIRTPRLTMASTLPIWIAWGIAIHLHVGAKLKMESGSPVPFVVWILLGALALESVARCYVALMQNRPMGSLLGAIGYALFYYVAPGRKNRISPFAFERGTSAPITDPGEEIALRDALKMREPFATLLSPPEQEYLARRFDYDYRQHASKMAWTLLFFAVCGVVTSIATLEQQKTISALSSLIAAAVIAVEQIIRLTAFSRGPVGSILGFLVRPFMRKLLA